MRIVALAPSRRLARAELDDSSDSSIGRGWHSKKDQRPLILHPLSGTLAVEYRNLLDGPTQHRSGFDIEEREMPAPITISSRFDPELNSLLDETLTEDDTYDDDSYAKRRPTSTKTLPQEKRQYPKEKCPPKALQSASDGGDISLSSSTDDYLKSCQKFGKYAVDTHSIAAPGMLNCGYVEEEERYGAWAPPLRGNSSDSGVAKWPGENTFDEGEDDWDRTMKQPRHVAVMSANPEDDDTLTSMEMINYDGTKAQLLTAADAQRYDRLLAVYSDEESTSAEEGLAKAFTKENKKLNKEKKKAKKAKKKAEERANKKKKKASTKKASKETMTSEEGEAGSEQTPSKNSRGSESAESSSYKQTLLRTNDRGHTMSTLSNSVPLSLQKHERRQLREVSLMDDDDECSETDRYAEFRKMEGLADDLSACSSGSLSLAAQKEFRKKKGEEHRRWLQKKKEINNLKKRNPDLLSLESDDWDDYDSEDRAKAGKVKSRRSASKGGNSSKESKKGGFFSLFRRSKTAPKAPVSSPVDPGADLLPWEVEAPKKGIIDKVLKKETVNTVDKLPFPASDSLDDYDNKYGEILDQLPTLTPAGVQRPQETDSYGSVSVSSLSYTGPDRKKPLGRAAQNFGNKLKSIFKPF